MEGFDAIGHLVSIEQKAAGLLLDAQVEADRRIAEARIQADNSFKLQYEQIVRENEQKCSEQMDQISKEHNNAVNAFISNIQSYQLNYDSFNALLNSLLFKE